MTSLDSHSSHLSSNGIELTNVSPEILNNNTEIRKESVVSESKCDDGTLQQLLTEAQVNCLSEQSDQSSEDGTQPSTSESLHNPDASSSICTNGTTTPSEEEEEASSASPLIASTDPQSQNTGIYTSEDRFVFRLHKIIQSVANCVLHLILTWGTQDKPIDMSFCDYFITVKKVKKSMLRSRFKKAQMESIQTDTLGKSFDISELYSCITWVYNETDSPMVHVRYIKNFRNELMHSKLTLDHAEFSTKTDDLRHHFSEALKMAGELKGISKNVINDHVQEMNDTLNKILTEEIVQWDITSYENELLFEEKQQTVVTVGSENLKALYKQWAYLTPLSFLSGNTHLHVSMVFTQLEIAESGQRGKCQLVGYQNIFQIYKNNSHENIMKRIILLEGPAGSGKTTLLKMIIDDWTQSKDVIKGLTDFQLLLYTECRNPCIKKFTELLKVLMPDVAQKFRGEDLASCLLACKNLLVVDGLDEMNFSSRMLFEEMVSFVQSSDVTMLITSRPEAIEDYYKMIPSGIETIHMKIKGIVEGEREEFAIKYHKEMERTGQGAHDTSGLVSYLRKTGVRLKDHWRLPLHLAMVVILWVVCPEAINGITTATELFKVTENLRDEKLSERVKKNEQCKSLSVKEIKEKIEMFRVGLYKIAIYGQKENDIVLTNDSLEKLEKMCKLLHLPESEVLGAFFVKKISWTGTGIQAQYSFAHKGTQDFYSALYIVNTLQGKICPETLEQVNIGCVDSWQKLLSLKKKSILNILREVYKSNPDNFNLKKFQNMLIHLTGLIDSDGDFGRKEVSSEIIKLLKKSGIVDEQAWLDIFNDIKVNETTLKEISKYVPDVMNLNGSIEITDSSVATYSKMMALANPTKVTIRINNDPMQVPCLENLLETTYYQKGEVELYLYHNFIHPHSGDFSTESLLPQLFKRSQLTKFMGYVDQALMRKIPEGLKMLCTAATDQRHCQMLLSGISNLPNVEWLWLHVPADIDFKHQIFAIINFIVYRSRERTLYVKKRNKSPLELARLEELLTLIDDQNGEESRMAFRCSVELRLGRDFKHPEEYDSSTDVGFQRLFSRFKVTSFIGCLGSKSLRSLPNTIRKLSILIIDNSHYKSLEPTLLSLHKTNPILQQLCLHISPAVSPSVLQPFPEMEMWVTLFIHKLQDSSVDWLCKVAKALQPNEWYAKLVLPELAVSVAGYTHLVEKLASLGVTFLHGGGIMVPLSWATPERQQQMEILTRKNLRCCFFVLDDDDIW